MRLLLIIITAGLMLSGCGGGAQDVVSQIQAGVLKACHYKASAESIASIIAASTGGGIGIVVGATAITEAVCAAVTAGKGTNALVATCPQVNGVCIKGKFEGE